MFWLALPVVSAAWAVQFFDAQSLLRLPAGLWAGAALLAWCLAGGRGGLLILAAGWSLCRAGWVLDARYPAALAGRDVLVTGYVCDFGRADPQALRFVLESEAAPPLQAGAGRLHLSWYERPPAVEPGQRWQLLVRLRPPRGLSNPGAFDFEQWLFTRRVTAVGYVRPSRLNRPLPAQGIGCPVGAARGALARRIEDALGAHPGTGYVLGIVVGATHRLSAADWDLLRRTGTTHLLAISGLNIAMVAAPFVWAGPWLGRLLPALAGRPAIGAVAGSVAAAAYCALAGFAVATVRALVMLLLFTLLAACRRRVSGPDLLAAAALLMVVLDPPALVSASFWLSYVAVAWLCVLAGRGPRAAPGAPAPCGWRRWLAPALSLVQAQLVLGLGLAPLTLGWFQQLSLVAPLTNLLAVPVFTLAIMPLALLGGALLAAPVAGAWLLQLAADIAHWLVEALKLAGALELAAWRPPTAAWPELALAAVAALLLCWWRPLPGRACGVLLLLPLAFGVERARPALTVTVMDVGQGLAVLVETRHHALLYDAGPAFRMRDAGESVVLPVMRAAGATRLDRLVVSHDDLDHRGGARSVLEQFPGATLLAPTRVEPAADYLACREGLAWTWDGVRFTVLAPGAGGWDGDNDGSCVLRVDAPRAAVLLPGDIGGRREGILAAGGRLAPADLVLAPHHGSRTSSSAALVAATRPRFVVFSAGHLNRWGFPAPSVAARWREAGACLLDTAASGTLFFATDGHGTLRLVRRQRLDGAHLWTADVPRGEACPPA